MMKKQVRIDRVLTMPETARPFLACTVLSNGGILIESEHFSFAAAKRSARRLDGIVLGWDADALRFVNLS